MTKKSDEIDRRRLDFWKLMTRGATLQDAVSTIHQEYGTSKKHLYKDWVQRETWTLYGETDTPSVIVQDVLFALNEVRRELWEIVENGPAHKLGDKIRALRDIKDLEFRCLKAAQSTGDVQQEPLKVSWEEREERVERLHQRVTEISNGDADVEEQICRLLLDISKSDN